MAGLTKRQAQIQNLLKDKLSAEAIADRLGLTVGTVRSHTARLRQRRADRPLTKREEEVTELIRRGLTNTEISARLTISARTAEVHRQTIIAKYNARNTPHLMAVLHEQAIMALQARISELETVVARLEAEAGVSQNKKA